MVGGTDARNSGTDYQNVNMVIAHFKSSKTSKNYALKMHRDLRWRGASLQGHEDGFFIGPSMFDRVTPDMQSYKDEIFGPVLQVVRADSLEEAARLPSEHQYGNGVALFTRNGLAAREFASKVNVGMVGINVPIPVPVAYHTFGGWKRSAFGDINQHGVEGIRFYTKTKTVTQRWPSGDVQDQSFVIPTMS